MATQNPITYFAQTNFRNEPKTFGIKQPDRLAHMYIVGKTGTGKSTLLETMIRQDIEAGQGIALLDPHGDLVERVLSQVVQQEALTRLLVEKGIFSEDEFWGTVRVVDREMMSIGTGFER